VAEEPLETRFDNHAPGMVDDTIDKRRGADAAALWLVNGEVDVPAWAVRARKEGAPKRDEPIGKVVLELRYRAVRAFAAGGSVKRLEEVFERRQMLKGRRHGRWAWPTTW
jgi:hypothetical protein